MLMATRVITMIPKRCILHPELTDSGVLCCWKGLEKSFQQVLAELGSGDLEMS